MKKLNHIGEGSGFTVMELCVVIGMAMLLMGIAVPSFLSWLPTFRLSAAARQVATDLQVARMRAVSQNTSNTVTFNTTTGTYTFTLGTDTRDIDELYPGISIPSVTGGNPVFSPRGTANAVTIQLGNGSANKWVCVRTVGRVSIQDSTCA
jgi:Tfp pilus assembly protein FimT